MATPPDPERETDDATPSDETLGSVIRVRTVWALSVVTVILLGAIGLLYDRLTETTPRTSCAPPWSPPA